MSLGLENLLHKVLNELGVFQDICLINSILAPPYIYLPFLSLRKIEIGGPKKWHYFFVKVFLTFILRKRVF